MRTTDTGPVAASSHHTKVIAACTKAQYKPTNYILACADGHFRHFHARFVLNNVKTVHGKKLFTEMRIHYRGHEATYQLPTKPI